jgi:hypothetical protein
MDFLIDWGMFPTRNKDVSNFILVIPCVVDDQLKRQRTESTKFFVKCLCCTTTQEVPTCFNSERDCHSQTWTRGKHFLCKKLCIPLKCVGCSLDTLYQGCVFSARSVCIVLRGTRAGNRPHKPEGAFTQTWTYRKTRMPTVWI